MPCMHLRSSDGEVIFKITTHVDQLPEANDRSGSEKKTQESNRVRNRKNEGQQKQNTFMECMDPHAVPSGAL